MSKNKIIISSLIITVLIVSLISCSKTTTVLESNTVTITSTVSFSKDLIPLLTANCAKSGCHAGTVNPNLSAADAYNSLVGGNFVNTTTPDNSLVYLYLTGKEAVTMPLGAANNPSNINGYMLAWITQGAKNN